VTALDHRASHDLLTGLPNLPLLLDRADAGLSRPGVSFGPFAVLSLHVDEY
jgi:GGDEF domain-containing protein